MVGDKNVLKYAVLRTLGFSELAKGIRDSLTYRDLEK